MRELHERLSVQTKMLVVLGVGLLGFTIYFGVNYVILKSNSESLQTVVAVQLPALEMTNQINNNLITLRSSAIQAVLSQNFEAIGQADRAHKAIASSFASWEKDSLPHGAHAKVISDDLEATYTQLNEILQNVVAGVQTLAAVQEEYKSSVIHLAKIEAGLLELKRDINQDLQSAVTRADMLGRLAMMIGVILVICAIATTVVFFVVVANVNRALNGTNGSLQLTSKRLLEMVDEAQVSSTQLRETANRQSTSSTETVVSMEQMKRLLSQTSLTSVNAVSLSQASYEEANDGKEMVQSLKDAMVEIERSNTELEEVNQVVKLIRERTNVINEIVFKTQMLSFNANIEAARAGQHGLGFAVVATEMGSLADMSGKAALQINELLDRSASKVESTVSRTKDKVGKANEISARAYDFFKLLTDRSGQLKEMVDSISSAAAEQNSGVDYVVNAMNDLNNTAAESDRMALGISMLADGLKSQAVGLASAVDSLNALVNGRGSKMQNSSRGGANPSEPSGKVGTVKPALKITRESA